MKTAKDIQQYIDDEFGLDIASFQNSELKRLVDKINEFLATGVETDDLE